MELFHPNGIIGSDQLRIDGVPKVTGQATYGADHQVSGAAHAVLATAAIARGRIRSIDQTSARSIPGVLEILTYENVGKEVKPGKGMLDGGYMAHSIAPLASNRIHFAGQIVAVVIAENGRGSTGRRRRPPLHLQSPKAIRHLRQPKGERGEGQSSRRDRTLRR